MNSHWNGNVIILTKFSSLAALEVVRMTTSSATSDENFIKMTTFPCLCIQVLGYTVIIGAPCVTRVVLYWIELSLVSTVLIAMQKAINIALRFDSSIAICPGGINQHLTGLHATFTEYINHKFMYRWHNSLVNQFFTTQPCHNPRGGLDVQQCHNLSWSTKE